MPAPLPQELRYRFSRLIREGLSGREAELCRILGDAVCSSGAVLVSFTATPSVNVTPSMGYVAQIGV